MKGALSDRATWILTSTAVKIFLPQLQVTGYR